MPFENWHGILVVVQRGKTLLKMKKNNKMQIASKNSKGSATKNSQVELLSDNTNTEVIKLTKKMWRSGEYHKYIKSKKDYYEAVHAFVEEFGEPLTEDTIVYHNTQPGEPITFLGCGWNPGTMDDCIRMAKRNDANRVYVLTLPKGTKVVKYIDDWEFGLSIGLEDEFVVDLKALGLLGNSGKGKRMKMGLYLIAEQIGEMDYFTSDFMTYEDWTKWKIHMQNIWRGGYFPIDTDNGRSLDLLQKIVA